jgi:hypothetical protein
VAKRVERRPDGGIIVHEYDNAALFTFESMTVPDLRTFGQVLYRLARDQRVAVLRGDLLPHVKPGVAYRRRARAGDGTDSLVDCAHAWLATDMDDVPLPAGVDWRDATAVALHLQNLLPPELRGVDCVLQWSAKMGFRAPGLVRCKLWFALTAPVADADLRAWAQEWNAKVTRSPTTPRAVSRVGRASRRELCHGSEKATWRRRSSQPKKLLLLPATYHRS